TCRAGHGATSPLCQRSALLPIGADELPLCWRAAIRAGRAMSCHAKAPTRRAVNLALTEGPVQLLSSPPQRRGGLFARLRGGWRRGRLLQLLLDVDRFAALRIEHDVERLHALVLRGKVAGRCTIAKQRRRRPLLFLLGLLLQGAQPVD